MFLALLKRARRAPSKFSFASHHPCEHRRCTALQPADMSVTIQGDRIVRITNSGKAKLRPMPECRCKRQVPIRVCGHARTHIFGDWIPGAKKSLCRCSSKWSHGRKRTGRHLIPAEWRKQIASVLLGPRMIIAGHALRTKSRFPSSLSIRQIVDDLKTKALIYQRFSRFIQRDALLSVADEAKKQDGLSPCSRMPYVRRSGRRRAEDY